MSIANMRTLRWMCSKTRKNRIRNERTREHLGKASIGDKLRETPLRWFGHIQHMTTTVPIRRRFSMEVNDQLRTKSRPKRTWIEVYRF